MLRDRGFTLIELITVIAVMAVLVMTAAPRLADNATFNTRGDLGVLVSSLRFAQKMAIAQHRTIYVQLDAGARVLQLCYTNSCDSVLQDPVTNGSYRVTFNSKATLSTSLAVLGFTADGTPTPNLTTTYTVTNSHNTAQTNTVVVEASTGYVHKL